MSGDDSAENTGKPHDKTSSEEFVAYCEAEFEHRRNSGLEFDEQRYQQAMKLAVEKLQRLEEGGAA